MSVSEAMIKRFIGWAEGQGGESVPLTNEYEIARIKHKGGTFVLYVNKKGAMSFSDSAARRAWAAFLEGKGWPMNVRHKRSKTEAKVARFLLRSAVQPPESAHPRTSAVDRPRRQQRHREPRPRLRALQPRGRLNGCRRQDKIPGSEKEIT